MGKRPFTRDAVSKTRFILRGVALLAMLIGSIHLAGAGALPTTEYAPYIIESYPAHNATHIAPPTSLSLTFSEPVALAQGAVALDCAIAGRPNFAVSGGPIIFTFAPSTLLGIGDSCLLTVAAELVTDLDSLDPPDQQIADAYVKFDTELPTAKDVVINEVDAVAGNTAHEFAELFDGGAGNTSLDGLHIVFYNGLTDTVYSSASLSGYETDANGYFLLSSDPATADLRLANGFFLDGPAAVALYHTPGSTYPIGSPVALTGVIDAVVYDSGQPDDAGLLPLLSTEEPQVNESGNGQALTDSNQRCPNGAGGQRRTSTFRLGAPTPAAANACVTDAPPAVVALAPVSGAQVDPLTLELALTFSEPVSLASDALSLHCLQSEEHALAVTGGPLTFTAAPLVAPNHGDTCTAYLSAQSVSDLDMIDPPDGLVRDHVWSFTTSITVATDLLINEVDSDTPGNDTAEFIEIFDGGQGNTFLNGLALVLFNGSTGKSYRVVDLSGFKTNAAGYFVVGSSSAGADLILPDAALQNGPDAVALYAASANDFPNGTNVTEQDLIDALVYGPTDSSAPVLMALLESGQAQVDENSRGQGDMHANQRCPDGSGVPRQSSTFRPNMPTPGAANVCDTDMAPWIVSTTPSDGAQDVPLGTSSTIGFSEPVEAQSGWVTLDCSQSGIHSVQTSGGPETYVVSVITPLAAAEQCYVVVQSHMVSDLDEDDPPDQMGFDFTWSFTTADSAADFVLINEADTNTFGVDTAEFIELYDGGLGFTSLDGLTVVLFNGSGGTSYQAVGLDGFETNAQGYFVIGSASVSRVDLTVSNGLIQNGPDAIVLYAASPTLFPNNTPVTTSGLLDAIVYGAEANAGLEVLLNAGQATINENGAGSAETVSMQRCPNGSGGPRNTSTIRLGPPTPGQSSSCPSDVAPQLISTTPSADQVEVATNSTIALIFSEPVQLDTDAVTLDCDESGSHSFAINGGPVEFSLQPDSQFLPNEGCDASIAANGVTDIDAIDPPDAMSADVFWHFETAVGPVGGVLINEFDSDTAGTDQAEFIELYDGGQGAQSLDGYILVLFNGQNDLSYRTVDLSGTQTDANGYLTIGGPDVPVPAIPLPIGALQNGSDAVALYQADPQQFPNGSPLNLNNLVDAVVYGTADPDDTGLLSLLLPGQPQIDESSRGQPSEDSNQRCGDGSDDARETAGFVQREPTPGAANNCLTDQAPQVVSASPANGSEGVAADATLIVEFDEPVVADADWLSLACGASGIQSLSIQGGPTTYVATPNLSLPAGSTCFATILAAKIHDTDANDPPDTLDNNLTWSFTIEAAECAADFTPIATIQGTGLYSPLQSQTILTMGVVTADFRDGLGGVFVQSPDDQIDASSATSEGILVMLDNEAPAIEIGHQVMIDGRVAELNQRTTLIDAEIAAVCGQGVARPTNLEAAPGTLAGWEALEGMLVSLGPATIVDNARSVPAGELTVILGNRPIYPTEQQVPGPAAQSEQEANWAAMFLIDDARIGLPPVGPLPTADQPVRSGNVISALVGVVDGYQGGRRVHAIGSPIITVDNPRLGAPAAVPQAIRIASIDLDVYANGNGLGVGFINPDGAQSMAEYLRQESKVVAMIHALSADVVAINGFENEGYGSLSATQDLLDALNAINPGPPYSLISSAISGSNDYPYQSAIFARSGKILAIGMDAPDIPNGAAQPQVVWLQEQSTGETFSIALVHLDTRDDCPTNGPNADQFDGQACHNQARTESAAALAQWLTDNNHASNALIIGTWNAFGREDPLRVTTGFGFTDMTPPSANGYTTARNRHLGATNRALAGEEISVLVERVTSWHINADESPAFDFRLGNPANLYAADPYRTAATDPLVIDLNIGKLHASFKAETPVFIGEAMQFWNESSGTGALQYAWNFGDGTPFSNERDPSHIYKRIGTYQVTLTTTDIRGSENLSQYVDVLPRRIYLPVGAGGR